MSGLPCCAAHRNGNGGGCHSISMWTFVQNIYNLSWFEEKYINNLMCENLKEYSLSVEKKGEGAEGITALDKLNHDSTATDVLLMCVHEMYPSPYYAYT